jgi:serine/threonine protein kinase
MSSRILFHGSRVEPRI